MLIFQPTELKERSFIHASLLTISQWMAEEVPRQKTPGVSPGRAVIALQLHSGKVRPDARMGEQALVELYRLVAFLSRRDVTGNGRTGEESCLSGVVVHQDHQLGSITGFPVEGFIAVRCGHP